jgi:hypothetical protein
MSVSPLRRGSARVRSRRSNRSIPTRKKPCSFPGRSAADRAAPCCVFRPLAQMNARAGGPQRPCLSDTAINPRERRIFTARRLTDDPPTLLRNTERPANASARSSSGRFKRCSLRCRPTGAAPARSSRNCTHRLQDRSCGPTRCFDCSLDDTVAVSPLLSWACWLPPWRQAIVATAASPKRRSRDSRQPLSSPRRWDR